MGKAAVQTPPLSVTDYLALEQTSSVKHEYVAGLIYAQAGTTRRHNLIAGNIFAKLREAVRGTPCRVLMADVKLRLDIGSDPLFYYPDIMVSCGPEPENPLYEDAPCLIAQVTSPSSDSIDRREKLLHYKQLTSVKTYLIVAQDAHRVTRFDRDAQGRWWEAEVTDEGSIPLACPELTLTVADIYENVG
jgi:Uma2 family endonuclease